MLRRAAGWRERKRSSSFLAFGTELLLIPRTLSHNDKRVLKSRELARDLRDSLFRAGALLGVGSGGTSTVLHEESQRMRVEARTYFAVWSC